MKVHSPWQKSKIFAGPLREGAEGGFAAKHLDKLKFAQQLLPS